MSAHLPTSDTETTDFSRLSIQTNHAVDSGLQFTIDVQLDGRMPLLYILNNITAIYPELEVKGFPNVSRLSLAGYCLSLLYAQLLTNDCKTRSRASPLTHPFRVDDDMMELMTALNECHVPAFMRNLLSKTATVPDPQRPELRFCSNLASCLFHYDFGYLPPNILMFIAHDVIASTRYDTDTQTLLSKFYRRTIVEYQNIPYTAGQFFGAPFQIGNESFDHPNWLCERFEYFFLCSLVQPPALSRLRLTHLMISNDQDWNPYTYALSASAGNNYNLIAIMKSISSFILQNEPSSPSLRQMQSDLKGMTLLSHAISSVELPTWHKLTNVPETEERITRLSDAQYAAKIHFLVEPPNGTFEPCNAKCSTLKFKTFNPRSDVRPPFLWYQPFEKSLEVLKYSGMLGVRIIQEGIDGVVIPLPNLENALCENNSCYFSGSIPARKFFPYIPTDAPDNYLATVERTVHDIQCSEPIGFALRDMSIVEQPISAHDKLAEDPASLDEHEENCRIPAHTPTYFASRADAPLSIPDHLLTGWSSYRHTSQGRPPHPDNTRFYVSLRGFYGMGTTYCQTQHIVKLMPQ